MMDLKRVDSGVCVELLTLRGQKSSVLSQWFQYLLLHQNVKFLPTCSSQNRGTAWPKRDLGRSIGQSPAQSRRFLHQVAQVHTGPENTEGQKFSGPLFPGGIVFLVIYYLSIYPFGFPPVSVHSHWLSFPFFALQ